MKPVVTLVLCLCALTSNAQAVYRCGNTYSESPCPQARIIDVSDERSDAQRLAAQQLAANDQQLGEQMAHERLAVVAAQSRAAKSPRPKPAKRARVTKIKWFRP